jgi:hypothetical protein
LGRNPFMARQANLKYITVGLLKKKNTLCDLGHIPYPVWASVSPSIKSDRKPGVVAYICNPSAGETEAR